MTFSYKCNGFCTFFDGSGCTIPNAPEALDSNECAQQSQKTFQWRERRGGKKRGRETWNDGIQTKWQRSKNSLSFKCFNRWIIASTHYFRLSACAHVQTQTEHHVLPLTTHCFNEMSRILNESQCLVINFIIIQPHATGAGNSSVKAN